MEILTSQPSLTWLVTPMREKLPLFSLVTRGPPLSPMQVLLPAWPAQIMLAVICVQGHLLLDIVSRLTFIRMLG